ncbi:MAG: hypothetical protein C5B47_00200 [Verrucomicrobia bacterium]|nr:MAG: hypothetical protein C5B47_00200 [Verrucomicrobiota bacterium]
MDIQLTEVVGDYLHRHRQRSASVTLKSAWVQYVDRLVADGASTAHRRNHERTFKRFLALHDRLVCELSREDIERILANCSKSYFNMQLRELRSVLNFAQEKEWVSSNLALKVNLKKQKLSEPEIYSPEQIQTLMEKAAIHHPALVPTMALMTFAGIRPDCHGGEITRITWNSIILDDVHKRIELPGNATKTGKRRTITMRPPLRSWIDWHINRGGITEGTVCPIKDGALRKKLRQIFSAANVKRIQDGLRHSFGACTYSRHGISFSLAKILEFCPPRLTERCCSVYITL